MITFRNPVTGLSMTVIRCSALGRAAEAVEQGKRGARQALRRICRATEDFEERMRLERSPSLQREALIKAAQRTGRTISWRSYAPDPIWPTWNDHVHGTLVAL